MTLADFFLAVNGAGIRLANVGGQLQLRGPANAISPEIKAGAAEHKLAILAMLPPVPESDIVEYAIPAAPPYDPAEAARIGAELEAEELIRRKTGLIPDADGQITLANMENGFRHDHDWRDWRLEWLLHVGTLYLRQRGCQDAEEVLSIVVDEESIRRRPLS